MNEFLQIYIHFVQFDYLQYLQYVQVSIPNLSHKKAYYQHQVLWFINGLKKGVLGNGVKYGVVVFTG